MTISGFAAYVKQKWFNKPNTSSPLSAERLTHIEDGVKGNSDAIEKIAAAVISQITNDPDKIASMAALYSVNQAVTQLYSNFTGGNLQLRSKLYNGSAASGIVATSRNNPISFENAGGQLFAFIDSNQIGYISTCLTNSVVFSVVNGRVGMYVDNNLIGYITTTTT